MREATALARITDALHTHGSAVRTSGGRTMAQCPSHEDHNPSLAVTGIEGQVLIHCHAGCHTDDVLIALNLGKADLYDEPRPQRVQGISAHAIYNYDDGRRVIRSANKEFRQDGNTKGNALFRLAQVIAAVRAGSTVHLVEGEKDVHAIETAGGVATTAPGGSNVHKCDLSPLHGAHVVAVVDRDDAGDKWASKVRDALDGRAQTLTFVHAATGKDAADHIAAGHTLDELVPIEVEDDGTAALLALVKDGAWLDAQEFPPTQWAVPGLIPEGFGLFTGAPKIGKSWAALGLGLAVACGGKALGKIDTGPPRPVLYLALEDGHRRLQSRSRQLLHGEPIPAQFHEVTDVTPANVLPLIDAWLNQHRGQHPLVMLDTLGKVQPPALPGESAYGRDYRVGSQLKRAIDAHTGATLLVIHHIRKVSGEDWMDSTSGTNGLNGAADFTVNLHRARNDTAGIIRVTGRDVVENEYAVTVNDGAWTLDGNDLVQASQHAQQVKVTQGLGDRSAEIAAYVTEQAEPVTAKNVEDALGIKDARRYLTRMVDADRLTRSSRGRYSSVPSVPSVPNEADLWTHPSPVPCESSEDREWDNGTHGTPGQQCTACGRHLAPGRALQGHELCSYCVEDQRRESA